METNIICGIVIQASAVYAMPVSTVPPARRSAASPTTTPFTSTQKVAFDFLSKKIFIFLSLQYLRNNFHVVVLCLCSSWSYVLYTKSATAEIIGNYSLVFYDLTGQRWRTDPLDYTARCSSIVQALEALPNAVIRPNTVRCLQWLDYHSISSQVFSQKSDNFAVVIS
jgi:hypothetical protein